MSATVTIQEEHAERLGDALALLKALATPARLAIVGALAANPAAALAVDEVARLTDVPPARLERDLDQLARLGLIRVVEWRHESGREDRPARVAFGADLAARDGSCA